MLGTMLLQHRPNHRVPAPWRQFKWLRLGPSHLLQQSHHAYNLLAAVRDNLLRFLL